MSKYINTEKLKAHIEAKMETLWDKLPDADKEHPTDIELRDLGMYMALEGLIDDLDSLQQEYPKMNIPSAGSGAMETIPPKFKLDVKPVQQEIDLEKEIEKYCRIYYNCNYPDQVQNVRCSPIMPHIVNAARYFYKLGKNSLK